MKIADMMVSSFIISFRRLFCCAKYKSDKEFTCSNCLLRESVICFALCEMEVNSLVTKLEIAKNSDVISASIISLETRASLCTSRRSFLTAYKELKLIALSLLAISASSANKLSSELSLISVYWSTIESHSRNKR